MDEMSTPIGQLNGGGGAGMAPPPMMNTSDVDIGPQAEMFAQPPDNQYVPQQMQQQMMQQQMQQMPSQQMQQIPQQQARPPKAPAPSFVPSKKKSGGSGGSDMLSDYKEAILFLVLFLVFNSKVIYRAISMYLPMAARDGCPSIVGLIFNAVIASFLFFFIIKLIK